MSSSSSHLPIKTENLRELYPQVNPRFQKTSFKPTKRCSTIENGVPVWANILLTNQTEMSVSILESLKKISGDQLTLGEDANNVLLTMRDGLAVGMFLAKKYRQTSGLEVLEQQQQSRGASVAGGTLVAEFTQKQTTASAVALFGFASYVLWKLGSYKTDEVSSIQTVTPSVPELFLANHIVALNAVLYYYGFYLENDAVKTQPELVKLTLLFFNGLKDELLSRVSGFQYKEFFTDVSYQMENTDFIIEGFEDHNSVIVVSTEFNEVKFDEIVGNRAAKHTAMRLAMRLACYDLKAKDNPFRRLGGITSVSMGYGVPGTGKSLQIAATATLLKQYCGIVGIPFIFWPLPDTIVSTFQGGSAERMVPWMKQMQNPNAIVYGCIDDAENNLEERTRQGVSAGVREVIGVFLRYTEGAYAIQRGNSVIQLFTNLPEQIDKAVLSRIQSRFAIEGAMTARDFFDQDYLWMKKLAEVSQEVEKLLGETLEGYVPLSDQAEVSSLQQIEKGEIELHDQKLRDLVYHSKEEHGKTNGFFATLYQGVKKLYPQFSSRDARNIQTAVTNRLMDFDLPSEWFENLDLFFRKSFEEKITIVKGLMRENMRGLSLQEMRYQEALKYIQAYSSIANIEFERSVNKRIDELKVVTTAEQRFRQGNSPK